MGEADVRAVLARYAMVTFTVAVTLGELGIAAELLRSAFVILFGALALVLALPSAWAARTWPGSGRSATSTASGARNPASVSLLKERRSMADTALQLSEATFDAEVGKHQEVLMVDFWAEWCAPCRALAPTLDQLARESDGKVTLAKVNVDENPALAARYGIRSIPTVLFLKGGALVDQVVGAVPKAHLKKKLDALA